MRDALPRGLVFLGAASAGWLCAREAAAVLCSSSVTLAPNEGLDLALRVAVGPEAFPSVTNTATVSAAGDPDPSDDVATRTSSVTGLADLSVEVTGPDAPIAPGQGVRWVVAVHNLGPNTLEELFLVDDLPSSASRAGFTSSAGTYDATSGRLSGLRLAPGEGVELTVTALLAATASGAVSNRALVSVPPAFLDPEPGNDDATSTALVLPRDDAVQGSAPAVRRADGCVCTSGAPERPTATTAGLLLGLLLARARARRGRSSPGIGRSESGRPATPRCALRLRSVELDAQRPSRDARGRPLREHLFVRGQLEEAPEGLLGAERERDPERVLERHVPGLLEPPHRHRADARPRREVLLRQLPREPQPARALTDLGEGLSEAPRGRTPDRGFALG